MGRFSNGGHGRLAARAVVFIPAILLAAVACLQLRLVESVSLSRWKGGGFGMYSETHPYNNALSLRMRGHSALRDDPEVQEFLNAPERRALVRELKTVPVTPLYRKLQAEAAALGLEVEGLEVYGYHFDPYTGRVRRRLVRGLPSYCDG